MNRPPGSSEADEEGEELSEEIPNHQLQEVLNFYGCEDLLPYVNHITWLSQVKEVIGFIPFEIGFEEIRALVILKQEISKKQVKDMRQIKRDNETSLDRAVIRSQ